MKKTIIKESLVYLVIWTLLLLTPIISMYLRMAGDSSMNFRWDEVFQSWTIFIPFLIIFLIHNFLVAPLLIYKKRRIAYCSITLVMLIAFTLYQCSSRPSEPPPMETIGGNRGPAPFEEPHFNEREHLRPPKPRLGKLPPPELRHDRPPLLMGQHDMIALIILILMFGLNLGIKYYFKSSEDIATMQQLEKKNLEQQLEYLKYQINPHFFMNTLNNIHALVDIDSEEAKHSIVELSRMMRYVLYDGARNKVLLSKEIEFLKHYITLMRLRYTDKVKIDIDIPDDLTDRMVPPMLFITFVENAFKHGVSYKQKSFIEVHISTSNERITFVCRNSKTDEVTNAQGGVGLTNARQRLNLIYGKDYEWHIKDTSDIYEVRLQIPFMDAE